jgi:hypothetical protein
MGEFFKGWRRKTGCVTLVMACILSIGWARCFTQPERMIFRTRNWTSLPLSDFTVFNEDGQLEFGIGEDAIIQYQYMSLFRMQYWTAIIPLTLLSAWLLLSKPRTPTPKPTVEPKAAERA